GKPGMPDIAGLVNGRGIWGEAKLPGEKLGPQQEETHRQLRLAGALVFTFDNKKSFLDKVEWLLNSSTTDLDALVLALPRCENGNCSRIALRRRVFAESCEDLCDLHAEGTGASEKTYAKVVRRVLDRRMVSESERLR